MVDIYQIGWSNFIGSNDLLLIRKLVGSTWNQYRKRGEKGGVPLEQKGVKVEGTVFRSF